MTPKPRSCLVSFRIGGYERPPPQILIRWVENLLGPSQLAVRHRVRWLGHLLEILFAVAYSYVKRICGVRQHSSFWLRPSFGLAGEYQECHISHACDPQRVPRSQSHVPSVLSLKFQYESEPKTFENTGHRVYSQVTLTTVHSFTNAANKGFCSPHLRMKRYQGLLVSHLNRPLFEGHKTSPVREMIVALACHEK